jgi:FixJ family two-component response regulator
MTRRPLICVIDDDESVRESLPDLIREFGFDVHVFSSAEEFLASESAGHAECLLLDIAMPGMTGLELQQDLERRQSGIPIIFITALADDKVRSAALRQGVAACLFKPFSDTELRHALNRALKRD